MDNVRLKNTSTGATITIDTGVFLLQRGYSTMRAAAIDAEGMGLISANQLVLLSGRDMVMPQGFSTSADYLNVDTLFDVGFKLCSSVE